MRRALDLLRQEGLVTSRRGAGWFAAVDPVRQPLGRVTTVEAAVEAAGATPGPRDPRVRVRRRAARRSPTRCGVDARRRRAARRAREPRRRRAVRARHGLGARRRRRRRVARRRRARTVLRPACRCAASSSAPCTRRSPPRSPTRATARAARVRARRPVAARAGASRATPTGAPVLVFRAPLSRRPHDLRDRVLVESRSAATCLNQIGPTTPAVARRGRVRAASRARRDRARAARPAADVRGEGARRARRRSARPSVSTRGVDYADYRPDRVAMQDATAQMALLQFMLAEAADGRGADDRALRPPDPGARRRRRRHAGRARRQPRGLRVPAHACRRSTASASGSRAAGSSTRSCSRTTRSRAA